MLSPSFIRNILACLQKKTITEFGAFYGLGFWTQRSQAIMSDMLKWFYLPLFETFHCFLAQLTINVYCALFLQNVRQLHAVAMLPSGQWGKLSVPGFFNKVIAVLRYSVDAEPNTSVNVDNKRGPKLQQRAYGVRVPGWPCGVTTFQHVRSFWLWITMASWTSPGHSYLCDLRHRVSSSNLRYYYRILPQVGE